MKRRMYSQISVTHPQGVAKKYLETIATATLSVANASRIPARIKKTSRVRSKMAPSFVVILRCGFMDKHRPMYG
jgi:hypothetical protein